jgi:hypothetical protein
MNVSQKCVGNSDMSTETWSKNDVIVIVILTNVILFIIYSTISYLAGKNNGRREALKKILDGKGPLEREEILLDLCAKACTKWGWVTWFDNDEYNELGTEEVHEHWLKKKAELEERNLAEKEFGEEGTWRRSNLTKKEVKEMALENGGMKAENMV